MFSGRIGRVCAGFAPLAVAALWQGAAVAVTLALCLRFAPRVSAAHRFAAWAAGFAVVACLPVLPLIAQSATERKSHRGSRLMRPRQNPGSSSTAAGALAIAALWIAASLLRAAALGLHSLRLRRLWKTATPIRRRRLRSLLKAAFPAPARRNLHHAPSRSSQRHRLLRAAYSYSGLALLPPHAGRTRTGDSA